MNILTMPQRSPEWFEARKGKISGTKFGQAISTRKNKLIYELLAEQLSDYVFPDDYISDDMQFGIDNEPVARELYAKQSGIDWREVGMIQSEIIQINTASPDGLSPDNSIVLEIKCTRNLDVHLQRFFEGIESQYMNQIMNYFVVSDEVKQVHFVSYCPASETKPLIVYVFEREHYIDLINESREKLRAIEAKLNKMIVEYLF